MTLELEKSRIEKSEQSLIAKGCVKIGDLWDVPLPVLKADEKFGFRRVRDPEKFESMALDIREKGILNPPLAIYSIEKDDLILAAGYGRVESLNKNKNVSVLCRVLIRERIEPEEIYDLIISDNLHREDMKPLELAFLYRSWMNEKGLTQKELAQRIHKSETYLSELLNPLKKLSMEEIRLILTSGLSRSQVVEIARIEVKEVRIELIKKRESVRNLRKLIAEQYGTGNVKPVNQRIFEFSRNDVRTSLGEAKVRLKIEFRSERWTGENILETLDLIAAAMKEFPDKDGFRNDFQSFDSF